MTLRISKKSTIIKIFSDQQSFNKEVGIDRIVDFLHTHLEKYGDDKKAIRNAIDYAFSDDSGKGGFVLVAQKEDKIAGVTVINDTGMKGYIPEHILVYIAVDKKMRGEGIGKNMLQKTKNLCDGDIALHVEADNPAKFLYKKMGFKTKYAEMRLIQN